MRRFVFCFLLLILTVSTAVVIAQDLPPQFILRNAASGRSFNLPVAIAFAPGNRIFVAEKRGSVYVIQNGTKLSTPFINLENEVLSNEAQGMLGIAFDPDFLNNRWVYLLYVVDPTGGMDTDLHAFSRLTRYRAQSGNLNVADLSTRQVLIGNSWSDGIIACSGQHVIGALRFGSDGTLLFSSGEASVSGVGPDAGGHHPECFGPGKFDPAEDIGAFRAQYLHSLSGKIVRIDKETGRGLPSNPYYTGNPTDKKSKVWAYGLRNPFRFGIRPNGNSNPGDGRPGTLYVGDVGWGQFEDINVSDAGGGENFGWPCFEGPREVSGYQRANPAHSDCNSIGTPENPAQHTEPLVYYHHTDPNSSKPTGFTGSSVTAGAFYTGNKYPAQYRGAFFFADYEVSWIRVLRVDQNDNFVSVLDFAEFPGDRFQHGIVDFAADPVTGDVFYVDITTGDVMQISYTGTAENQDPVAIASANKLAGPVPLTIDFTGSDSFDPDGDPITFEWDFGDGSSSTQTNPSHTYGSPGTFNVQLTVRDNHGGSADFFLEVIAGSEPPVPTISSPSNGLAVFPNETIFLQGSAVDADEPESNLQFVWEVDQHHKDHIHPAALTFNGKTASFVAGSHGDPWDFIYLEIKLKVTDTSGLTGIARSFVVIKVIGESDITNAGSPIALITNPTGSGNPDIGVIKDNVFPAVGSNNALQQYDTNTGGGSRPEDWIGYEFNELRNFSKLIFQEGIHFANGGWFETLQVEVRRDGNWQQVFFLNSVPPYPKSNGVNYESFSLLFAPQQGDGIRIKGDPGGSANFISVGELRVVQTPFEPPQNTNFIFEPSDDSFVRSSDPTKNYGASGELRARKTSSSEYVTYLKFSVSGLSGQVQSAKLRLYVTDASNHGGDVYVTSNNFQGSSMPWNEAGLIWTNAPTITGSVLSSLGTVTLGTTIEHDVTGAISSNGVYTFVIRSQSTDIVIFDSKESIQAPQLIIETQGGGGTPPVPQISGFSPTSGSVGTVVDIDGVNLTGTTEVRFGGTAASNYAIESDTHIHATVPAGATTGKIRVTTPGGSATSVADFTVESLPVPEPTIAGFTPTSGPVGTSVTIQGSNFTGATGVKFNNVAATFTVVSGSEIRTSVPVGATTGKMSVTTGSQTGVSSSDFSVTPGGGGGDEIALLPIHDAFVRSNDPNKNFGTSADLRARKTSLAELLIYLKFVISGVSNVQSAKLRLRVTEASNSGGAIYSASNFLKGTTTPWSETTVIWPNAPDISATALATLGSVTQNSTVEFDVTAAISGDGEYSFAIRTTSSDQLTYGSKQSSNPPQLVLNGQGGGPPPSTPVIASFTPTNGPVGTAVTVLGSNFTGATAVRFNGVLATFNVVSNTEIRCNVPTDATTGTVSLTTPGGTATSSANFTVTSGGGGPQTLTFNSTEDAFVWSANPSNNYGGSSILRVRTTSATQIAFLKFNVASLGGPVTSAKIRLVCTDASNAGGGIYSVSNNWSESGLIWSNAPVVSGSALSSVGAVAVNQTVEWDVTAAISGDGIYSFAIRNNSSDAVYYSSKEGAQTPSLVITTSATAIAAKLEDGKTEEFNEFENLLTIPETLVLLPNYPNPFNAETTFEYGLPEASDVRLMIYNVRGQEVKVLVNGYQNAGFLKARWDGRDNAGVAVSSGWYFTRLTVGNKTLTGKLLLQK